MNLITEEDINRIEIEDFLVLTSLTGKEDSRRHIEALGIDPVGLMNWVKRYARNGASIDDEAGETRESSIITALFGGITIGYRVAQEVERRKGGTISVVKDQ